ncbi:MAG: hypothetical protein QXE31_04470 [Candidatus Woesearchaeota archaeon]
MKKAIMLSSVIVLIISVIVILVALNGILVLTKVGEEARELIFPEESEFSPTIFAPKNVQEINVENSVKALICSINAITYLDKNNITDEKKFNDIYKDKEFWKKACGDIKPSYYTKEMEDNEENEDVEKNRNTGKLCTEKLGVCLSKDEKDKQYYVNKALEENLLYYKPAEYNPNNKDTCPEEKPYCRLVCDQGGYFKIGGSCNPGKKECAGIGNDMASYCLATGVWCQRDCSPGFLQTGKCSEDKNIVYCEDSKKDITEDLKIIAKQVEALEGIDCTEGKVYGSSCVKCAYDINPPYFKCYVNNFNLPQEFNNEKGFFDKWIAGFGDPKYLIYYEAFPDGEDQYWKADYGTLSPIALYSGAISAVLLPVNPNIISKAIAKAPLSEIMEETFAGGIIKSISKQSSRIKNRLFLAQFQNKELVYKIEMIQEAAEKFGGKLNPFKEFGEIDTSQFIPIYKKYIDNTGKLTNEEDLFIELSEEINRQWSKKYAGTLTKRELELQADEYASILVEDLIKPTLNSKIDVAAARIARNFEIPLTHFFGKGELSEEALDTFLNTGVKRGEDLNYIINSGLLKKDFDLQGYLKKVNDALDKNLDPDLRFGNEIKIILENLEKRNKLDVYGNLIFTKTPLGILTDQVQIKNKLIKIGLSAFNTEHRAFTLILISWLGDLIDSENQKLLPHGVNKIVLKTPNMFGYGYEYDLKNANPYTIIIRTKGKDNDAFKRMYFASPCKADLEVSKVEFHQILTSNSFWQSDLGYNNIKNYDIYNFGSGDTLVKKNTLGYKKIEYNFKLEEKVNDVSNYRDALQKLKEIDSSFNENTKLSSIFSYAEKKLNEGDIEKALKAYVILAKYYPLYSMDEDVKIYEKIDKILTEPNLFLKIEKDKLKEIAFEELNTLQERGEFFYKYMNDENCKSVNNYIKNNCDEQLDNLEFSGMFVDSPYIKYLMNNFKNEYITEFWNYYLASEEKTINYLTNKYKASLLYINNPYNYQNKNDEEKEIWKEYYSDYPSLMLKDYGNFKSGKILIPTHIKYKIKLLDGKKIPEYPNFISFSKFYLPIYVKYKEDINFKDDSDIELFEKKEYYEDKAIETEKEYFFEKDDLIKWISISQEIQRRGLVDASFAVKIVDNLELKDDTKEVSLSSWGIEINAHLHKIKEPNYCYQSYDPTLANIIGSVSLVSMFVDDVAGSLAAFGCASTGVGATATTVCYKGAAALTNYASAKGVEALQKLRKWPSRGDI